MSFDVAANAYDGFMGRYSRLLSCQLADWASLRTGQRVLDVGCGTGALTSELVRRLGPSAVAAVDPSEPFVAATRERHPGVDVRASTAEHLPFPNATFDAALAQLVVHFMKDPVAGLAEMGRVTRQDGVVAACVWDHGGGEGPLRIFWDAARTLEPKIEGESQLAGARKGHLAELFEVANLRSIESTAFSVSLEHPTFDAWWEPFRSGVGPAGAYLASLGADQRIALREECRRRVPTQPFTVTAVAWAARGLA
ncbi:MAG: class I SAM-dependent methyltransferase [Pseudomonadota bacterium]